MQSETSAIPRAAGPSRLYALVAGLLLTLGGVAGLLWESDFATGNSLIAGEAFGLVTVNGWTNVLHLALGLVALGLAPRAPRQVAGGLGAIFLLLALTGFAASEDPGRDLLGLLATDTGLSLIHLALGVAGLAAFATARRGGSAEATA